jgi:hypothetical protein
VASGTDGSSLSLSYFNTSGYFPTDADYFASSGVDTAPLHAASGTNGVLGYGENSHCGAKNA